MTTESRLVGKGWFKIDGVQDGERDLAYQLKGLEVLLRKGNAEGKTVLDLGCAEGLISRCFREAGALSVDGLDMSAERIAYGREQFPDIRFLQWDLNKGMPRGWLASSYDVVLLLAVLHKLAEPRRTLHFAMALCSDWLAIRAPAPVICDRRSDFKPLDVKAHMGMSFDLVQESDGHPDDPSRLDPDKPAWLGVFRRRASG